MNILYVTNLSGSKWAGPNYSVPNQISAQAQFDNVFWYNLNNSNIQNQSGDTKCYGINDYPTLYITDLPYPFNKPDLVIFQGLYFYNYCKLGNECRRYNIPYIIIPRSSLTSYAQRSKYIKKKIGNLLFFNRFIKGASSIQYLTLNEYKESQGSRWNENNIIIPNGIKPKTPILKEKQESKLRGIFIGRLDVYQKGIDLFLQACQKLKEKLLKSNCIIEIYGPDYSDNKKIIESLILDKELNDIVILKGPVFDKEKENIIINSDFFILTSRFEGHPMGLIEALSYGIPCLVTKGTNMAEEIETSGAGWTADFNIDSIVNAFQSLLIENESIEEKGKAALELSKKYSWNKIGKDSSEKYKKVAEKTR